MAKDTVRREWREKHRTRNSRSIGDVFTPMQLSSSRSRLMALGCIALVSGVVGATITGQVFAYKYSNIESAVLIEPEPVKPQVETTTVIVAARQLRFGDKVDSSAVREATWIAGTEPKGSFKTVEEFLADSDGRAALGPLEQDEPILSAKVTGPGQRSTLSRLVADNKRAITLAVDEVFGVAGFVLPGDRVDVVLTRIMVPGDATSTQSDIIAQNVKVLAVDQQADQRLEEPNVARAVTLEVDTNMAQRLALGSTVGKLALTLRGAASAHQANQTSVSFADLSGGANGGSSGGRMNVIRGVGNSGTTVISSGGTTVPANAPQQVAGPQQTNEDGDEE